VPQQEGEIMAELERWEELVRRVHPPVPDGTLFPVMVTDTPAAGQQETGGYFIVPCWTSRSKRSE